MKSSRDSQPAELTPGSSECWDAIQLQKPWSQALLSRPSASWKLPLTLICSPFLSFISQSLSWNETL